MLSEIWQRNLLELRIKCCKLLGYRLADFDILVGRTLETLEFCAYFAGPGVDGEEYILTCSQPKTGRYVKIQKRKDTECLTLCEVEVMGRPVVHGKISFINLIFFDLIWSFTAKTPLGHTELVSKTFSHFFPGQAYSVTQYRMHIFSRLSLYRPRLSRITAYLEVKI